MTTLLPKGDCRAVCLLDLTTIETLEEAAGLLFYWGFEKRYWDFMSVTLGVTFGFVFTFGW